MEGRLLLALGAAYLLAAGCGRNIETGDGLTCDYNALSLFLGDTSEITITHKDTGAQVVGSYRRSTEDAIAGIDHGGLTPAKANDFADRCEGPLVELYPKRKTLESTGRAH